MRRIQQDPVACLQQPRAYWIRGDSDAQVSRPSRGVADRFPDGRGHAAHLRGGRPSLRRGPRRFPAVQDALLKIDLSWAQELCIYMFVWMAKFGAAYGVRTGIHVGVDVMINRLPDNTAQALCAVRPPRGRRVHWHRRHAGRDLRLGHRRITDSVSTRPRSAEVDRLPVHSARLVPDVLPLPAGGMGLLRTGELPHHDVAHVEGIDEASAYALDANLHPAPVSGGQAMSAARPGRLSSHAPRWPALIPPLLIAIPVVLKLAGVRSTTRGSSSRCCSV